MTTMSSSSASASTLRVRSTAAGQHDTPGAAWRTTLSPTRLMAAVCIGLSISLALVACEDEEAIKRNKARQAEAKEAALNHCSADEECSATGCRGTICRAAPEPRFCPHRLIVRTAAGVEPSAVKDALRKHVASALTGLERQSLDVSTLGPKLTIAFHAPLETRQRIESMLAERAGGGVHPAHEESVSFAEAVLSAAPDAARLDSRPIEGGPALVEAPLPAGDQLSLADVRDAIEAVRKHVEPHRPDDGRVAYEPLVDASPPVLRVWLLDPSRGVDFAHVTELERTADSADVHGRFDETGRAALATLTRRAAGAPVVFVLGDRVLAAPRVTSPIEGGEFSLMLGELSRDDPSLMERLEQLEAAPKLSGLALDADATADAERELRCYDVEPPLARCGCVEGRCRWVDDAPLRACTEDGAIPDGHRPSGGE